MEGRVVGEGVSWREVFLEMDLTNEKQERWVLSSR